MEFKSVFKRYELKFILSEKQYKGMRELMQAHMTPDKYCEATIRNVYFDTPDMLLIRKSLEKPKYKEKMRIRTYEAANSDGSVFMELKKKYNGVVYKRRCKIGESEAYAFMAGAKPDIKPCQVLYEMEYFRNFYSPVIPSIFLKYDREAYKGRDDENFRMTFDTNILYRDYNIGLYKGDDGISLLDRGEHLLEVKTAGAIPLWLCSCLSEEKIYKISYSKYGRAYEKMITQVRKAG